MRLNIIKYYLYVVFSSAFVSIPVMVLFWQDNGLNMTQIMILQSIFSFALILCELPTGSFADVFSRKMSLAIAGFGGAIGMFVYSLGQNFYQFALAEIIFALTLTFSTGADSAFLYDTLAENKKSKQFKKILGNSLFWALIASSFASIAGGFIGKYNLRLTVFLQVPIFLAAGLIAITLKEPKRAKFDNKLKNYFKVVMESGKQILNDSKIFWLMAFGALTLTAAPLALWFYQPYMKITGLDILYFGFAFAFYNIVAAIFSKYAHKIEDKIGMNASLILITGSVIIGFILMGYITWVWGFVFGALFQIVRGFNKVIIDDYLNRLVTSEKRATILSFQSLAGRISFAIIAPIFGFLADKYTIQQSLKLSALTFSILMIPILLIVIKNSIMVKSSQ